MQHTKACYNEENNKRVINLNLSDINALLILGLVAEFNYEEKHRLMISNIRVHTIWIISEDLRPISTSVQTVKNSIFTLHNEINI